MREARLAACEAGTEAQQAEGGRRRMSNVLPWPYPLSWSHINERLATVIALTNTVAWNPAGFLHGITEHVHAVEGLTDVAFEAACRTCIERGEPISIAEFLGVLREQMARPASAAVNGKGAEQ
jgi:hypothetical protein